MVDLTSPLLPASKGAYCNAGPESRGRYENNNNNNNNNTAPLEAVEMPPATRNEELFPRDCGRVLPLVLRLCVVMKAHEILQKGCMCGKQYVNAITAVCNARPMFWEKI